VSEYGPQPDPRPEPEESQEQLSEADAPGAELPEALAGLVRSEDEDEGGDGDGRGGGEYDAGVAELIAETGHADVDGALARLSVLDGVPAEEHSGVYEDVHERLQGILAALDRPPGPPAPTPYNADIARRS
jgi:hypothetical protein